MTELKINIRAQNDRNIITEKVYPVFEDDRLRLKSAGGFSASDEVRIFFEPSAVSSLFSHIAWGKVYRTGDVEQGGILIGNYFLDNSGEHALIWGEVTDIVPADPALVTASFDKIDFSMQAWQKMREEGETLSTGTKQIIGWYHTHLDYVNARFSSVDRITQRRSFTYKYSFGVVLNPNRKQWTAFYGPESRECKGDMLLDENIFTSLIAEKKITIKEVNGDSELREDGTIIHLNGDGTPIENNSSSHSSVEAEQNSDTSIFSRFWDFLRPKPAPEIITRPPVINQRAEVVNVNSCEILTYSFKHKYINYSPPNYLRKINPKAIIELIRKICIGDKNSYALWGIISQDEENRTIFTTSKREAANTGIIFIKNADEQNKIELISERFRREFETKTRNKIRFFIYMNMDEMNSFNVKIINFTE